MTTPAPNDMPDDIFRLIHEAYEVYAGMEGGKAETAYEGYLLQELEKMAILIGKAKQAALRALSPKAAQTDEVAKALEALEQFEFLLAFKKQATTHPQDTALAFGIYAWFFKHASTIRAALSPVEPVRRDALSIFKQWRIERGQTVKSMIGVTLSDEAVFDMVEVALSQPPARYADQGGSMTDKTKQAQEDAAMQPLGSIGGKPCYFAEEGRFAKPGFYYWDGTENVHVPLTPPAALEKPAPDLEKIAEALEWFNKVIDGNIEHSYPEEVKTIRATLSQPPAQKGRTK